VHQQPDTWPNFGAGSRLGGFKAGSGLGQAGCGQQDVAGFFQRRLEGLATANPGRGAWAPKALKKCQGV